MSHDVHWSPHEDYNKILTTQNTSIYHRSSQNKHRKQQISAVVTAKQNNNYNNNNSNDYNSKCNVCSNGYNA